MSLLLNFMQLLEENQDYCTITFKAVLTSIDGAQKQWNWGASHLLWAEAKIIGSIGKHDMYVRVFYNGNISKLAPAPIANL